LELVHTCSGLSCSGLSCSVVVLGLSCSGCRVGLSCSICRVRFPPFLPSSLSLILPILPSSKPQNPTNLSPQSIDRITWRARSRSSWQQESITGQEDARRQSAFDLTISEKSGLRGASSTQDGFEKLAPELASLIFPGHQVPTGGKRQRGRHWRGGPKTSNSA